MSGVAELFAESIVRRRGPSDWYSRLEPGDFSEWDGTSISGGTIVVQSDTKYAGVYASKARCENNLEYAYSHVTLPDEYNEAIINLKVYLDWQTTLDKVNFLRLNDSNGNEILSLGLGLYASVYRWVIRVKDTTDYTSPAFNLAKQRWYKIILRVKRGASDGFVKLWVYRGDINVYDDEADFFWLGTGGTGNLAGVLSDDTIQKFSGELSTKLEVTSGTKMSLRVIHHFPTTQDWSEHDNFHFALRGQNTQTWVYYLFGDEWFGNYWYYWIFDDFIGWKQISKAIDEMEIVDTSGLNLGMIKRLQFSFGMDELIGHTMRIDRIFLTRNPLADEGLQINQTGINTDSGYRYAEIYSGITYYPVAAPEWTEVYTDDILVESPDGDLFAKFQVTHWEDLKAIFTVKQETYVRRRVFCKFSVRRSTAQELKAVFNVGYPASNDLFAKFETSTVIATPLDLLSILRVRPTETKADEMDILPARRFKVGVRGPARARAGSNMRRRAG